MSFHRRIPPRARRLVRPMLLAGLRRTTPLSDRWGYDRGQPIDRYYIERFLDAYRGDIRGNVLEVKDDAYTRQFGDAVRADVLDIDPGNARVTIVADLAAADVIEENRFTCFVLTQTLQYVYNLRAAVEHAHRILQPGGVLLVTLPGVSRVTCESDAVHGDYWRFTRDSAALLFREVFGDDVMIRTYGNVFAAIAFLTGMAREELTEKELDVHDERFPVIVAVRARKR
jgi:SAM-dependent methyltransferase